MSKIAEKVAPFPPKNDEVPADIESSAFDDRNEKGTDKRDERACDSDN